MIGVFKPLKNKPKKTGELYKSVYCSVCLALKKKYGFFFSLFICHEVVQMVVSILQYCSCMEVKLKKCPICFNRKKKEIVLHNVFEKAADCCLVLVWFKIMDSRHDGERLLFRLLYFVFKGRVKTITETSPNMDSMIARYLNILDSNDIETIMQETGIAAKSIYSEILSQTEMKVQLESLLPVADLYGRIIALTDPVLDYKEDVKKQKITPLNPDNIEHYTNKLIEYMNSGKTFIAQLEKEKKVSLYFLNIYLLSCYNIENQINDLYKADEILNRYLPEQSDIPN